MSETPVSYLRYSDSVEVMQPDEEAISQKIVESMGRMNQHYADQQRHASRDAHAKSHGVLVGTLTVHEGLAAPLRQGVFAEPRTYPVVVRLSSSPGSFDSDQIAVQRGMAIKILDVHGPKVLPEHRDETTQDLLMVNFPVIPFGDVASYLKVQQFSEATKDASKLQKKTQVRVARGVDRVFNVLGVKHETVKAIATPNTHILGQTFHSMAALRYGDYLAKISAAPHSPELQQFIGQTIDGDTRPSALRDRVVAFFQEHSAEWVLRAQLCTDLERMPVEDASVRWSEELSPHQPIATLHLPRQEAYSHARRVYADDVLSFNPWHCIEAHRPLGSIMRVRRLAYEASSRFRHEMNVQPRVEPKSISDIPA